MRSLLLALVALCALAVPTFAQNDIPPGFDFCAPPTTPLPAIPPCEGEKTRDQDALVNCIVAFFNTIRQLEQQLCKDYNAAVHLLRTKTILANNQHKRDLAAASDWKETCLAEGNPPDECEAGYQQRVDEADAKLAAKVQAADAEFVAKREQLYADFVAAVAQAQQDFLTCLEEEAPCK